MLTNEETADKKAAAYTPNPLSLRTQRPARYSDEKARVQAAKDIEEGMSTFKGAIEFIPATFDHGGSRKASFHAPR